MLGLNAAHAGTQWTVNPFEVCLEDSGRGARQAYQIINNSDQPMDVVATPYHRIVDEQGNDTLGDLAEDVFIVVPAQIVVPAGSRRTVRVQYVGPPVEYETPFRLMFEEAKGVRDMAEAPDDGRIRTVMQISMRYNSRLFVVPAGTAPTAQPVVSSWDVADGHLQVNIANQGDKHAVLGRYAIAAQGQAQPNPVFFNLDGDVGIIPARGNRMYRLPLPATTETIDNVGIVAVEQ